MPGFWGWRTWLGYLMIMGATAFISLVDFKVWAGVGAWVGIMVAIEVARRDAVRSYRREASAKFDKRLAGIQARQYPREGAPR